MTISGPRLVEAGAVAVVGGALAAAVSAPWAGRAVAITAAAIGGLNGAVSGWRGIYDWSDRRGFLALGLDSTWALPSTFAGLVANAVGIVSRDAGYVPELSERNNRHVYRRGFMPRKGFAITVGSVISGAGDVEWRRRARLVTDHEDVHVWQARYFGPLYPILYTGWMTLGSVYGIYVWGRRYRRQGVGIFACIESAAYFLNPFEWWAYSRDDSWPPNGKIEDFGWRGPCCQPLTSPRPERLAGLA